VPPPMTDSQGAESKRSVARLRRLGPMLEGTLDDPVAALELLVSEVESGSLHQELWNQLHAAAGRDEKNAELGAAYENLVRGRRLKALQSSPQVHVLLQAADFFQSVLGNAEVATEFLERVIAVDPEHAEAFSWLEHKYKAAHDDRRLAELLAAVAAAKKEPPVLMIGRALGIIEVLPAEQVVSYEACERLVRSGGKNPRVIAVVEAHCKKGGRYKEAASLLELAIAEGALDEADLLDARRRALALYLGELKAPEAAIVHIEELVRVDPSNADARKAAERLLSTPSVAKRAAEALQESRRRRSPDPA
jgi:tetratricopeptide (TPR) repeat protein